MATRQQQVNIDQLAIGMYVSALDRPWVETPFALQGFHIRENADIQRLQQYCKYVYIDLNLGRAVADPTEHSKGQAAGKNIKRAVKLPFKTAPLKYTPVEYKESQALKKEVVKATIFHKEVSKAVVHIFNEMRRGKDLNIRVAKKAAGVMVNSIIRNPDALVWLSRVKEKDSYSYSHSVRSSIWATVLGRHLGLPKDALEDLALGVLLSDVGKTRIPRSLLMKPGKLTEQEYAVVQKHVEYGVEILKKVKGINDNILAIVHCHHERHDGTGYPYGLTGNQIPMLARIAGIVDCYDALTSPRPYAEPKTSAEAVSLLYDMRDKGFQGALVEQFIQAVGIYPTGTLVKLSSDEVGIVIAQNRSRRLRPKVMMVTDASKSMLKKAKVIDLLKVTEDATGKPLSIASCLTPGDYDIYPKNLRVSGI